MNLEQFKKLYGDQNLKTSFGKPKVKRSHEEDDNQKNFVKWFYRQFPKEKLIGIPNEGKRSFPAATRMRLMGMLRGAPDVLIPVPMGFFHGLFIEMKSKKGKVKSHQEEILSYLKAKGYYTKAAFTFEEAKKITLNYLYGKMSLKLGGTD